MEEEIARLKAVLDEEKKAQRETKEMLEAERRKTGYLQKEMFDALWEAKKWKRACPAYRYD